MFSCFVVSLGEQVLYNVYKACDLVQYDCALQWNDTDCAGNHSDITNAWSLPRTPCGDQTRSLTCCCFCVLADSALTHARIHLRPVLGSERLYLESRVVNLKNSLTYLDFLLIYRLSQRETHAGRGDTNAPPDRHLDVASGSNVAPLECWDCDQGISHLTAHAL